MTKIHEITVKGIENKVFELIVDGQVHKIDLARQSAKLAEATDEQVNNFIISPSGYGIHWPQVDEDLAIDPMLGIPHEVPNWKVAEKPPQYLTKKDEL